MPKPKYYMDNTIEVVLGRMEEEAARGLSYISVTRIHPYKG